MSLEEINSASIGLPPEALPIDTPPEKPMQARDWLQATGEIVLLFAFILPVWTVLGIVLIAPSLLLKKYSHEFSEANQKRIDQLYAFSTEIFTILTAIAKFPLAYLKPLENVEKKDGRPILLVHGYLHNSSGWTYFLKRLGEKQIGPIYTIDLGFPFLPLSVYAKRIEAKVKEIGRDDLILVGHSMGGVVASLYATKLAPEGKVTDVFTLASPLSGSHLASTLGIGPDGREMRPEAAILAEVRSGMEAKKSSIRFHHAGSDADLLVSAESALSGCGRQLRVSDLGHVQFLSSDKIIDWIGDELQSNDSSGKS